MSWVLPVSAVCTVTLLLLALLSFDTVEYQEIGLNYSWVSEIIEEQTYSHGRYYLGLGNHFIKFPRVVSNFYFGDEYVPQADVVSGPALQSRTRDGLMVNIEVSFQYKFMPDKIFQFYQTFGDDYIATFQRMAIETLTIETTRHAAHDFFHKRTVLSDRMHHELDRRFKTEGFAEVPFFQLRTVALPKEFEDAIQDTQVKEQEIKVARAQQDQNRINYETRVLQADQQVKVLHQKAEGEAASIFNQNDAYCRQYSMTQTLQAEALRDVAKAASFSPEQLLEYVRIRAVREHPSENTVLRL